ncbi:MAG: citrate/2-methylcitrate synthase [Candidatus Dormibacteria bacterium]
MSDTLTIIDNRTGARYEIPVTDDSVRGADLQGIRRATQGRGLLVYDPALGHTAACRSSITYLDGETGTLLYRGYPIEQLAAQSTFLETAYLLTHGELPTEEESAAWVHDITIHTMVHENLKTFIDGFHHDAHPMGMLLSTVGALASFYPRASDLYDEEQRRVTIARLIAKMPTIAALIFRHANGLPYNGPVNDLSYVGNFLNMMFRMVELRYEPLPEVEHALDVLFILLADHEQNCSTYAMRAVGSAHPDPYSTTAAAIAALYGQLQHGFTGQAVVHMLERVGSVQNVPAFVTAVKSSGERIPGFGHPIYRNYDPRARIIKSLADSVFSATGPSPLLEVAREIERIVLEDDHFISRGLFPTVDFYSGFIYQALGIPVEMFPVLFAIPRTAGWLAQWEELLLDPEQSMVRPRQLYTGHPQRDYVPFIRRSAPG